MSAPPHSPAPESSAGSPGDPVSRRDPIDAAAAATGSGPLTEALLAAHVAPLFSRSRSAGQRRVYLANHSLGRPLDLMEHDVCEGLAAWFSKMGGAWDAWMAEIDAYRERIARLLNAPGADCIVPKTSAGQGLRAILNTFDAGARPRVVATRGEFDSLDVVLREYARRGRIALTLVDAREGQRFESADIVDAIGAHADLVVISEVMFNTGQRLDGIGSIVERSHGANALVLLDVYHSLGAMPVDVTALGVDFAVGGSYKYLRGGPGACFLYLHPRHLDGSLRTLDIGWFAKREPFSYRRPDPPEFAEGGNAFLESTPPVLTCYQSRAGQRLALALGPARIRAYSLLQQRRLVGLLASRGIDARGGADDHGAFVVVTDSAAARWCAALSERGVIADSRGEHLRLCPDVLTTDDEMVRAAEILASIAGGGPARGGAASR